MLGCPIDDGRPIAEHLEVAAPVARRRRRQQGLRRVQWSDVAAGMMLYGEGPHRSFELGLLQIAQGGWLTRTPGLDLLLLADCPAQPTQHDEPVPAWLVEHNMSSVHWRCYRTFANVWDSLWRKSLHLLELLSGFSSKRIYLKLDVDTVLMPESALRYINALVASSAPRAPLYFGAGMGAVSRPVDCLGQRWVRRKECYHRTSAWIELAAAFNSSDGNHAGDAYSPAYNPRFSYAQGGAYGLDHRALLLLTSHRVVERVVAAVATPPPYMHVRLPEDWVVGLTMHLRGVALHACGCFHFWGPCDVFNAVKDCVNKLCYLPITVHKMKRVEWYASWWQFLSGREAEQLAQLDAAEAEASTRSIARRKAT